MGCILRPGKKEWKNGILPFQIRRSDFNATTINRINEAISHWNTRTNWRIIPRGKQEDYVIFVKGEGCSSPLGRQGCDQKIRLTPGCSTAAIIHEIGHAVGFAHEQNRKDRDNYVVVLHDRVEPGKRHNFRRVNSGEFQDHGEYDFGSVMHYGRDYFIREKRYDWSSNFDNVEILTPPGNPTLFLLKSSTGDAHNFRLKQDFIGHEISRHDWTPNWTSSTFYNVGNKYFLFLLKESTGIAHINEVSGVGDIGRKIKSYDWSDGWSSVEFYQVFNKTFLLLLKVKDGSCHIHEMKANGHVGSRVRTINLGRGWTDVKAYKTGDKVRLFRFNSRTGQAKFNEVSPNGSIGPELQTRQWRSGWDVQEFYTIGGKTYLFMLKPTNGIANVYRILDNGTLGGHIQRFDWHSLWTHAKFYTVGPKMYMYLHKQHSGEAQIRTVSRTGRIGNRVKMNPKLNIIAPKAIGRAKGLSSSDIAAANARI